MSDKVSGAIRFVVGSKADLGGNAVYVRVGEAAVAVQMLPNSAIPNEGDGIFVFSSSDGNFGLALNKVGHPAINLPAYGGPDPVATGFYIPVAIEQDCTIVAVRALCTNVTGASVSDTLTFNIHRIAFGSGASTTLNPSPVGPTASYKYEDTTLTSWTLDLAAHDSLILEVVGAPASTTGLGVWLEVVPV